ncbi:MAG: hypothetical protein U0Q18_25280 [Bryobacteraceae bacterium]
MKRIVLALLIVTGALYAQSGFQPVPPDCSLPFQFSTTGVSVNYNNIFNGCNSWTIVYSTYNVNVLTGITVQQAPDNGGTPGSWTTFGAGPYTTTPFGTSGILGYVPWVRVSATVTFNTGGYISGVLIGWKPGHSSGGGGGGGSGSGCGGGANCYNSTIQVVPSALTAVTATTTYVQQITCSNNTNAGTTILITDTAGNPYVPTATVLPGQFFVAAYGPNGVPMVGIKWQAGAASTINCQITGSQ